MKTPFGNPASFKSSAILFALNGTSSDGLSIIVLPSTKAFGMVQFGTMLGKLNGEIEATTPIGKCSTLHSTPLLTSSSSPDMSWGIEQANSVNSALFKTSAFASS